MLTAASVPTASGVEVTVVVIARVTKPSAKRSAVRSVNLSSALAALPNTVPAAQSVAEPSASSAAWTLDTDAVNGDGKASSHAPTNAGTANQR